MWYLYHAYLKNEWEEWWGFLWWAPLAYRKVRFLVVSTISIQERPLHGRLWIDGAFFDYLKYWPICIQGQVQTGYCYKVSPYQNAWKSIQFDLIQISFILALRQIKGQNFIFHLSQNLCGLRQCYSIWSYLYETFIQYSNIYINLRNNDSNWNFIHIIFVCFQWCHVKRMLHPYKLFGHLLNFTTCLLVEVTTHKQLKMHWCILSMVATDALGPIPETIHSRLAQIRSCDPNWAIAFHKRWSRSAHQIEKIQNQTVYCQLNHDINHSLENLKLKLHNRGWIKNVRPMISIHDVTMGVVATSFMCADTRASRPV